MTEPLSPILRDAAAMLRNAGLIQPPLVTPAFQLEPGVPMLLGHHNLAVLLATRWAERAAVTATATSIQINGPTWAVAIDALINGHRIHWQLITNYDRQAPTELGWFLHHDTESPVMTGRRRRRVRYPAYRISLVRVGLATDGWHRS